MSRFPRFLMLTKHATSYSLTKQKNSKRASHSCSCEERHALTSLCLRTLRAFWKALSFFASFTNTTKTSFESRNLVVAIKQHCVRSTHHVVSSDTAEAYGQTSTSNMYPCAHTHDPNQNSSALHGVIDSSELSNVGLCYGRLIGSLGYCQRLVTTQ